MTQQKLTWFKRVQNWIAETSRTQTVLFIAIALVVVALWFSFWYAVVGLNWLGIDEAKAGFAWWLWVFVSLGLLTILPTAVLIDYLTDGKIDLGKRILRRKLGKRIKDLSNARRKESLERILDEELVRE